MPTALDRVQVLLQPAEYAELSMCAKEERRSLASMAAVLINEAIKTRIQNGTFVPAQDDPAYANAKTRQVARSLGQKVPRDAPLEETISKMAKETGATVQDVWLKEDKKRAQAEVEDTRTQQRELLLKLKAVTDAMEKAGIPTDAL